MTASEYEIRTVFFIDPFDIGNIIISEHIGTAAASAGTAIRIYIKRIQPFFKFLDIGIVTVNYI